MGKYDFDAATRMIEQWKKEHRWKSRGWMLNKIGEMWMGSIKESSIQDETIDFLTRKLEATFSALKAINDEKNSLEKKANALYGVSGELEFEGIAENIDTEKFEAALENNRKYQEQLHEEAIKRATAEFQGYCKCLEEVRDMMRHLLVGSGSQKTTPV